MTGHPTPDPDYGNHVCRRAIRLTNVDGATLGELEDSVHAIRCRVEHAAGRITRIEAEFVRHPMSTCQGALAVLDNLVGLPLGTTLADFYADGKARQHCTHAYDLVWYAIAHAGRDEAVRRYDSIVPDHPDGKQVRVQLLVDGRTEIDLQVADDIVVSPAPYAGQHLRKGFVGWAMANLAGEELDTALVLHKGYFIGQSHIYRQMPGPIGEIAQRFKGACYTYTEPHIDVTEQLPSRRYFPDGEGLLEFRSA